MKKNLKKLVALGLVATTGTTLLLDVVEATKAEAKMEKLSL